MCAVRVDATQSQTDSSHLYLYNTWRRRLLHMYAMMNMRGTQSIAFL